MTSKEMTYAERFEACKTLDEAREVFLDMSYELERSTHDRQRLAGEAHSWWSALEVMTARAADEPPAINLTTAALTAEIERLQAAVALHRKQAEDLIRLRDEDAKRHAHEPPADDAVQAAMRAGSWFDRKDLTLHEREMQVARIILEFGAACVKAASSQQPSALPEGFPAISDECLQEHLEATQSKTLQSALLELQMRRAAQPPGNALHGAAQARVQHYEAALRKIIAGRDSLTQSNIAHDALYSDSPAQLPEKEQQSYTEPDGCPTELAVLQRFWRENPQNHAYGPTPPPSRPTKAVE